MAKGLAPAAAIAAWVVAAATLLGTTPASAASLVEISGFGQNPTNLRMHVYAPDVRRVAATHPGGHPLLHGHGPGILQWHGISDARRSVRLHRHLSIGHAQRTVLRRVIAQALRRNGGSDPVGIMSMVTYVIQSYGANANRVYVTGASSGAMMTNVLLGDYPDVFKAGAAFMGVPHSCFATTDGSMWNSQCANGQRIMTAQQWGDLARGAFPGYSRARARACSSGMAPPTPLCAIRISARRSKQWTNVLGLSSDTLVHRHAAVRLDAHALRRHRRGRAGGRHQCRQRAGHDLPLAGQARDGHPVLRIGHERPWAWSRYTGTQRAGESDLTFDDQ